MQFNKLRFRDLFNFILIVLIFLAVGADCRGASGANPTVKMYIFTSKDCAHCEVIRKQSISGIADKIGCTIEPKYFDIGSMENYMLLVKMEEKYGDTDNDEMPVVFIGTHVLGGEKETKQKLEDFVREYAEKGGCPWPGEELSDKQSEKQIKKAITGKRIYLAYFYQPGCQECQRIHYMMKYLPYTYPNVSIKKFNLSEEKNKQINEVISQKYNVPDKKRMVTATIFIGHNYLQGKDVTDANLEKLITKYSDGTECPWEIADNELVLAKQRIITRFNSLSLWTVLIAGLIDGVNPCAFATIIFFISYLTFIGRKGREILLVGGAFAFSVFMTYLLVGLGVFSFVQHLTAYSFLSRTINVLTLLFAVFLGVVSFYDFFKARQGKIKDMKLQLPKFLKKRIQLTITREVRIRKYLIAALSAGFIVSFLELACTGQVYLPTIIFITGQEGMKGQGVFYLIFYNLMFIVPLVIIFTMVYFGTSSEQLGEFMLKHIAGVKFLTAIFFLGLAGLMLLTLF